VKKQPLLAYFALLALLCAAVVIGARMLGKQGAYLAQFYMLTPAVAAVIARLLFYEPRFSDACLRFGRLRDHLKYWLFSLAIVGAYFVSDSLLGAMTWDLSGEVFLDKLAQQFAASGQDMQASLPPGFTPQVMLLVFFIGGLTFFNWFPGIITGFGEEFGHRGFMFPLMYRIRPWVGLIVGGLIWYAWHLPLLLVVPQPQVAAPVWQAGLNALVLAIGSIATFTYLAYVYVCTRSIFVVAVAHITMNNASAALSYFVVVQSQYLANLGTVLVMVLVVLALFLRGEMRVFREVLGEPVRTA